MHAARRYLVRLRASSPCRVGEQASARVKENNEGLLVVYSDLVCHAMLIPFIVSLF